MGEELRREGRGKKLQLRCNLREELKKNKSGFSSKIVLDVIKILAATSDMNFILI